MIALSSLVALSSGSVVTLITSRGHIVADGDRTLRVPDADNALRRVWGLDEADSKRGIGGLFVVPGIEETLRLNGSAAADAESIVIAVEETFLQCPKAFVRSRLWDPSTWNAWNEAPASADDLSGSSTLTPSMRAFVERSPFGLICTEAADGHGDVSPRGDPPGLFVRCLDEKTLLLPDRTGNHLVDTLRNVLSVPRAFLLLMIPGASQTLELRAKTRIVTDESLLAPSAVKGKAPKLGILLELEEARLVPDALGTLWNPEALVSSKDFPTMGQMILDQVNPGGKTLNKIGSAIFDLASSYHKKRRLY